MQQLNHDMDDLMRRAADDYPVKPQGMNWDNVAQQLATTGSEAVGKRYGGLKKLLLLVPLVLLSLVCDRFLAYEYGHLKKLDAARQRAITSNPTATFRVIKNQEPSGSQSTTKTTVFVSEKPSVHQPALFKNRLFEAPSRKASAASTETDFSPDDQRSNLFLTNVLSQPMAMNGLVLPVTKKPVAISPKPLVEKKKTTQKSEQDKGYLNLLMGPDYSRVKGQEVERAGYNVGIMGGVWFAKRWAVETGLLWDRKNYFSKGDYFKTNKLQLPEHTKILQVDGYCAMFEIPVNLRYKLVQSRRDAFTISVGSSSYLMHKEDYNYVSERYGINYTGNVGYQHASKNWFSVMNLSLAYEHQLGQKLNIHIEPYIKLPVRGIGIGSLPISSKGVFVGLTYPIH